MQNIYSAFDAKVYKATNNDKSIDILQEYIERIRDVLGIEITIATRF